MLRRACVVCALLGLMAGGCRGREVRLVVAVALLPNELPVYRRVLGDFERASGIALMVVPQQYADIRRALAAEAFAGSGTIDLVELDVYSLAAAAPYVLPLDGTDVQSELDVMAPASLAAGRINGLRFLPHRLSWQALVYDHDVLKDPPATWAELLAVARAHPGQIGFKGALYEGLTCDILPFVWAAGGSGDQLDDAGALAAFRFFADLAPYVNLQSATMKEATIAEALARGEIILELNWASVMPQYVGEGLAPQRLRSAPLPSGPQGRATVLGGGYLAVPRGTAHRALAIRLAWFLISRHAQEAFARDLGWFSARDDVAPHASDESLSGFIAMRDTVRPRPERPDYARLSRLWQQAFRAVVFDHADPAATLRAAAAHLARSP